MRDRILDAAAELFLRQGYAATSIEAIATTAGVSKRTLYARFRDKGAIFPAVVGRLIAAWLAGFEGKIGAAATLEAALDAAAAEMLAVALTPQALALHRLVTAEAGRFPELAAALREGGAAAGIERLARLLQAHAPRAVPTQVIFWAEQFQHLVIAGPQSRALGLGEPLDAAALAAWRHDSVALFLRGMA